MLIRGDARAIPLRSGCVDCIVTSPPYFNLRNYGHPAQIGLEPTPEEYIAALVAIFREVRRVLKPDGTCWIVMGDSYASSGNGGNPTSSPFQKQATNAGSVMPGRQAPNGYKPKDLLGIPWRLAFALQAPEYKGRIVSERDRIWLACAIEAEGCIFIHRRKEGQSNGQGYTRKNDSFASGLEVANTSEAFVLECQRIAGIGSICHQDGFGRKQRLWRWSLRSNECRDVLREVYPYLVTKQQQARLAIGCLSSGEKAVAAHAALKGLHNGIATDIDGPIPESMFGPGWYLRSDIVWSKCNPMPESVTDRPTKSHEYVFLLTKQERYYYDQAAIAEPIAESQVGRIRDDVIGGRSWIERGQHSKGGQYVTHEYVGKHSAADKQAAGRRLLRNVAAARANGNGHDTPFGLTRNKRSVWTIATEPYAGAHFATMPEALIEPCILAGCPLGGIVLDPFVGSGTVGAVATRLGRRWIGLDLAYQDLAKERTAQLGLPFAAASSVSS